MARKPDFFLTENEIEELDACMADALRSNDLALHRRARALLLVGRDDYTRYEAAEVLGIEYSVIFRWQQRFRRGGVKAMATRKSPGKPSTLNKQELEQLTRMLVDGPEACGFDTGTWTSLVVCKLVKKTFGHSLSASQIRRILNKLDFSYQVPKRRLASADPDKQKEWSERRFPALLRRAEEEDAEIFFRTSPSFNNPEPSPEVGRGWVRDVKS